MRLICLCAAFFIGHLSPAVPAEIQPPLVVWNVTFNDQLPGLPPQGMTKKQLEEFNATDDFSWLPLTTYRFLSCLTRTRQVKVVDSAGGLDDKPLLLSYSEGEQPHWGPQVWFVVPSHLVAMAKRWKLSLDVSKSNVSISGGFSLYDVASVDFTEAGAVRVNGSELGHYASNQALHFEFEINVPEKTFVVIIDGKRKAPAAMKWTQPDAAYFSSLRLDGLLPGGHSEAPSSLAFDNIKLMLKE